MAEGNGQKLSSFVDGEGRRWALHIDVNAVRRVKKLTGVDIPKLTENEFAPLADMMADTVQFVDVVYCVLKDQADELRISDEQFGRGLSGDRLEQIRDAFLQALADFFPGHQRGILLKVFSKMKQVGTAVAGMAERELDAMDVAEVVKKFGTRSGNAPASSGATPGPSP